MQYADKYRAAAGGLGVAGLEMDQRGLGPAAGEGSNGRGRRARCSKETGSRGGRVAGQERGSAAGSQRSTAGACDGVVAGDAARWRRSATMGSQRQGEALARADGLALEHGGGWRTMREESIVRLGGLFS